MIYCKLSKRLATPHKYTKILEVEHVQPIVDGVPEGDPMPQLLVTIDNFAQLMNVSVRMDNLEPMTVWVPEAFLPPSLMEELNPQNWGDSEFGTIKTDDG